MANQRHETIGHPKPREGNRTNLQPSSLNLLLVPIRWPTSDIRPSGIQSPDRASSPDLKKELLLVQVVWHAFGFRIEESCCARNFLGSRFRWQEKSSHPQTLHRWWYVWNYACGDWKDECPNMRSGNEVWKLFYRQQRVSGKIWFGKMSSLARHFEEECKQFGILLRCWMTRTNRNVSCGHVHVLTHGIV